MKKSFLYFISCFMCTLVSTSIVFAQKIDNLVELKQQSKNELFHNLKKAPHTPAFKSEGYWVWGSSVVKGEDGKYHMFGADINRILYDKNPRNIIHYEFDPSQKI